jgi:hypothetical protein
MLSKADLVYIMLVLATEKWKAVRRTTGLGRSYGPTAALLQYVFEKQEGIVTGAAR